jgi:hypothetical protein
MKEKQTNNSNSWSYPGLLQCLSFSNIDPTIIARYGCRSPLSRPDVVVTHGKSLNGSRGLNPSLMGTKGEQSSLKLLVRIWRTLYVSKISPHACASTHKNLKPRISKTKTSLNRDKHPSVARYMARRRPDNRGSSMAARRHRRVVPRGNPDRMCVLLSWVKWCSKILFQILGSYIYSCNVYIVEDLL